MPDDARSSAGVYGPRELQVIVGAYRAILQEISETGALVEMCRSALSAREIRRLAAKQVFVVSAVGIADSQELAAEALARLLAARPAAA